MSSLVVVPFLEERPEVVLSTLRIASEHPRVTSVIAVSGGHMPTVQDVSRGAQALPGDVRVIPQRRLGTLRPGKGDAMNTGLHYFLENTGLERVHFYDADITSFESSWIDQAESMCDLGYDCVRHYYPRAATDAMITWWITRVGFALVWPRTALPWIEQPLSGELLFTRSAAEAILRDPAVRAQSDWGIDTAYTFAAVSTGLRIAESYVAAGKHHALYGALTDIRQMLVECFAAVQTRRELDVPTGTIHHVEYPHTVSPTITEKLGYDQEATADLLRRPWTDRQRELLEVLPEPVSAGALSSAEWPAVGYLDEAAWRETYRSLLTSFAPGDADWEEILFRLWITRVLAYTQTVAIRGHSHAMKYLHEMVVRTLEDAVREL